MSKFVDVEWFGREDKIGIVLTYDEFDGFKARMAPSPKFPYQDLNEAQDINYLMSYAAKIPFEWAWGIFGKRMVAEWDDQHPYTSTSVTEPIMETVRYDHRDYDINTLQEVKS
ncbi:MAG TPA: hypothetical protein VNG32_00415 [Candidatus Dormibacteraeota bacterium]|nr:hypothetical protein [Candidatus Dormibacteraeota bacterium]